MSNTTRAPGVNRQEWAQTADSAKEAAASAGETAQHAVSSIAAMAGQTANDIGEKADELTASAGAAIQGLGDRLSNFAPQTGPLGSASQAVAKSVKDGGKYIEDAKLTGIAENIAQMIRRNPIPAVCIGIGLGWFLCRKLKG